MARFEWLGPPNGKTLILNGSSITVSSTHATSQLQFRPLQQSHNGSYSCRAITDQDTLTSEPIEINVQGRQIISKTLTFKIISFFFSSLHICPDRQCQWNCRK